MDSSDFLSSRRDRIKANNYNNQKATEYPNKMPRLSSQDLIDIKRGIQEVSLENGTIVLPKCGGPTCNQDVQEDGSLYPLTPQWRVSTFYNSTDNSIFIQQITSDNAGNFYIIASNFLGSSKILKIDNSGNTTEFYSSSNLRMGITYYAGYIYFFDKDGSNVNRIVRISTDPLSPFPEYSGFTVNFTIDSNYLTSDNLGNIYYSTNISINKFNVNDFSTNNTSQIMLQPSFSIRQIAYYNNKIYFSNILDASIKVVNINDNIVSTFAGGSGVGNIYNVQNLQAKFNGVWGIAIDQTNGDVYITDGNNHQIKKISNGYVTLFAGTGGNSYVDGLAIGQSEFGPIYEMYLTSSNGLPQIYVTQIARTIRLIKYS